MPSVNGERLLIDRIINLQMHEILVRDGKRLVIVRPLETRREDSQLLPGEQSRIRKAPRKKEEVTP